MPAEPLSDRSGRGDTNSSYACLVPAELILTVSSAIYRRKATERSLGWLVLLGKSLFTGRVKVQGVYSGFLALLFGPKFSHSPTVSSRSRYSPNHSHFAVQGRVEKLASSISLNCNRNKTTAL